MIKEYKVFRQTLHPHLLSLIKTQMEMEIKTKCVQSNCTEADLIIKNDVESVRDNTTGLKTNSYCSYSSNFTNALMYMLVDFVAAETSKSVVPTYSYWRKYRKGSTMFAHTDRESCEYSITACIALEGNSWPIHFKKLDGSVESIFMQPGDFVLYKGIDLEHWREEFVEGSVCYQTFLHYVDKNGPYSKFAYDKRD